MTMTPSEFRDVLDALLEGRAEAVDVDTLVDVGELAFEHEIDQVSFLVGYELGRRRFVPTREQARRLRLRGRT